MGAGVAGVATGTGVTGVATGAGVTWCTGAGVVGDEGGGGGGVDP